MFRAASQRYFDAYRGLPRDVWLLALVLFVNRSGAMVLPFLTLYLTSQLELTEVAASRMITAYGVGAVVGAYFGGRLSERLGAFRVQTVCMFIAVPLFLLLPLWKTWIGVAISLFVLALFQEAVRPANALAISRVTNSGNRTRAFALQRLAANLGFSFGPAIGGVLASINFGLLFVADALTTLAAAILLLTYFRMRRVENPSVPPPVETTGVSPLSDVNFALFLLLVLATHVVFMQFLVTYPLYLRDHYALSKTQIGLLFAVNTTIIVLLEMLFIDFVKRWPLVRLIGWGSCLACLGFGMLPFGTSISYAVVAMLVVTLGEMLCLPSGPAFVAQLSPEGCEGRYLGWFTVVHSVAWIVAPLVGASLYGISHEAIWYCGLVVAAGVLLGYRVLANRVNHQPAAPEKSQPCEVST